MTLNIQIDAELMWQLQRTRRGRFLATCEPLALTLEADTEEEAKSLIEEGLHFFFLDHLTEGTLQEFLKRKGWAFRGPLPTEITPDDAVTFDVPFELRNANAA